MRKIVKSSLALLLLVAVYSLFFIGIMSSEGQIQNVNPLTALYWVIVTITTLGYGDIVFHSQLGRIFTIIVALSGIIILWAFVLPLGITPQLENLVKASPSSVKAKMNEHIIISGFNPMVETLTERLIMLKIPFLIIERSEEVARSIYRRYPTLWGDPSEPQVLAKASISSARLFIANENEEMNAEVILTVREISDISIIALVDDLATSRFLSYAGASRVISPKTLSGTFIAQITLPPKKFIFPGAIRLFGELKLVELPIYPGSVLIGQKLNLDSIKNTGASMVGIWQRGVFVLNPGPEEVVQSNSVLMAVGDIDRLSKVRDLTLGARKVGSIIILGYGDVGRRVAKVLCENGIKPIIVDHRDLRNIPLVHITGDATSEASLLEAGIKDAVGILVLLPRDSDVIYSTLLIKNLNPHAFIVARANHIQSVEKIYRAGADYVAAIPILASHILDKIVKNEAEELALLHKDLELRLFPVGKRSPLVGSTLAELDLPRKLGCMVVAIEKKGEATVPIVDRTVIEHEDILALIGRPEAIDAFNRTYDRKITLKRL